MPRTSQGRPCDSKPLLPQYYDIVGRNFTNETFHPDEILAMSFVLCANQPSMALLAEIEASLGGGYG